MLAGKRVLIVEDEPIVAMMLEDILLGLSAEVVGPALTLASALAHVSDDALDAAILDLNLNGTRSIPVADALKSKGVPFIFATGYGQHIGAAHADAPLIEKPYRPDHLEAALRAALRRD